jgi:HPt (histidine-containing phosphotransfer) domain-containing protein
VIYQEIPVVDRKRIDELSLMDNDGSFLKELVELFSQDSESSLTELQDSLREGDLVNVKKVAHRLKGSALSIGANRLAALANEIELEPEPDHIDGSAARLSSLRNETINELQQLHAHKH